MTSDIAVIHNEHGIFSQPLEMEYNKYHHIHTERP